MRDTRNTIAATVGILIALALILPVVIMAGASLSKGPYQQFPPETISLDNYRAFVSSSSWRLASVNSLAIALASATLAALVGGTAAVALSVAARPTLVVAISLLALPVIVPAIVAAVAAFRVSAAMNISGRPTLILVHTTLAVPIVVAVVWPAARRLDAKLYIQAASLGAKPLRVLQTISWPLLRPAVAGAWLLALATSLDELVFALFLTDAATVTLPVKMWRSVRFDIDPAVTVVGTLLGAVSVALFIGAYVITRHR